MNTIKKAMIAAAKKVWKEIRRLGMMKAYRYWKKAREADARRIQAITETVDAQATCLEMKLEMNLLRAPIDLIEQNIRTQCEAEYRQKLASAVQQEKNKLRRALLEISGMTNDQLRDATTVGICGSGDRWEVIEGFCQWGGCEVTYGEVFSTERQALENAYIRSIFGEKNGNAGICGDCYQEYMEHIV